MTTLYLLVVVKHWTTGHPVRPHHRVQNQQWWRKAASRRCRYEPPREVDLRDGGEIVVGNSIAVEHPAESTLVEYII
jgi:hypothetical protein